jgi:hypothetical protein
LKSLHSLLYFFSLPGHDTNESKELETVARVSNLIYRRLNMSHFSLKTFLRKTPYTLIKSYFKSQKLLGNYDWGGELDLESLTEAISDMGDNAESTLCDFERIHNMANDIGAAKFIDESRSPLYQLDIVQQLSEMHSHHERSMFVFLNYPKLFRWTSEMVYIDSLSTSSWKICIAGLNLKYTDSDEIRQKLGAAIAKYFHEQGRGRHCVVDYYYRINSDRHCFFAYPENYATEDLVYEDRNKLSRRIRRPVMEVIFVYNPQNGMLYVHARGDKFARALQEIFCKEVLQLDGIPDENTKVIDLSILKDSNFRFVTDPADNIESIILKGMELHLPGMLGRKITVNANAGIGSERLVFEMMDRTIKSFDLDRDSVHIKRAKIKAKFRSNAGQRGKEVTFFLASPNGCTLNEIPHHNVIKRYLNKWGFEKNLLLQEDAA